MIRQQAFIGKNTMLKGGLHCHTTRSDGALSPEEAIRLYKSHNYDFLAITDHRIYNYKDFDLKAGLTIIPGMEYDSVFSVGDAFRCFHTVCLGPHKENGNGFEQDQTFESAKSTCQEEYQPYLDEIHKQGNLTIYCHPEWSSTPARYFEKLKGNFAMEIWNSVCAIEHGMVTDAAYWDELLGQGQRIYGVAADDGHAVHHHCHGWVMVNAENNVNAILAALKEGCFYSTTGPVIKDFYVSDEGIAHIECSGVSKIRFISDGHPSGMVRGENDSLTSADFNLRADWSGNWKYVRAAIYAADGTRAWTNPIWLDD